MTSVERVGEQSREQHHRYYGLFGSDPANGDGFAELHTTIREIGQQASDAYTLLSRTEFSSAADAGMAGAQRSDRDAFSTAAAIASAAAAAADSSAQLNIRGAAAIAAHMEGEAARLAVIPDRASPDGIAQTLATIDVHQAKSLSTVEQLAATAQDLGRFAQMAEPHAIPVPVQLSQLSESPPLSAAAQTAPATSHLEQLSQLSQLAPSAAPAPAPPHAPDTSPSLSGDHEVPSAPIQQLHDSAPHDAQPAELDPHGSPDTPDTVAGTRSPNTAPDNRAASRVKPPR